MGCGERDRWAGQKGSMIAALETALTLFRKSSEMFYLWWLKEIMKLYSVARISQINAWALSWILH